jgi:crotonobetainyl-CoA:carnitine CoA-transferase CaiB-like acyl-CoA transferase
MSGALRGVTVVDFGQYIAGPLTTMLLADQGADVIRVDPPGGPVFRTPANQVWNRGKRRIVLDLTTDADRLIARRLVEQADVVVENFRPGVMRRLGLGPADMLAANPTLVYCSLPGFAHDDPRAAIAAWEGLVQAAAAVSSDSGGDPIATALPISSVFGAFFAVVSASMALLARERDGLGQWIEVPLFDATLGAHGFRVQRVHAQPPVPNPDDPVPGLHSWMGAHRCKDGRYVFFHPGNKRAESFVAEVAGVDWEATPDRSSLIDDIFRSRTAAEWEEIGAQRGTEIVEYRSSARWLREPHAREAGLVVEVDDPLYGKMTQPGVQVHLRSTPGRIGRPAPEPDADRAQLLELSGRPDQRAIAARTTDTGADALAALHGIKVLELTILLAGPTCGRTLMEFGADVIKIENPNERHIPASWVPSHQAFHVDVNRGKRSITIDLKTPEGIELFWRLAANADVLVENYRPGVLDALGIGYEAVHERNPRLVFASINTYSYQGPWRTRPGHEHLGQAVSGMAERFGGDGPPKFQHVRAAVDHGTGLMAAYAIALALLDRERTGEGQQVNAALAMTGTALQASLMYDFDGRVWDECRGQQVLGSGPLQRLYRAADGWLYVGCRFDELTRLLKTLDLDSAYETSPELEHVLETKFATDSAKRWVDQLIAAGLAAHELQTVDELVADDSLKARGVVVTRDHQGLGLVDQLSTIPRLTRTPTRIGSPSTPLGSEGPEIIADSGPDANWPHRRNAGSIE